MFRSLIIVLALLSVPYANACARGPVRPTPIDTVEAPVRLEPIEVRVTRSLRPLERTPAAVSQITGEELRGARRTMSLDEALAAVPGVVIDERNTLALDSRVSIRGFGARSAFGIRGVRILVDGIPLTMPDGQATLTNLDMAAVERIDVMRGPASALYGNAAGGVIAIRTGSPSSSSLHGGGRVTVGDAGTPSLGSFQKFQGHIAGRLGRAEYSANLSRMNQSRGFRDHARARQTQLTGRVRLPVGTSGHLGVVVNVADQPLAENPGALPLDSVLHDPSMAWPANVQTRAGKEARQLQIGVTYGQHLAGGRLGVSVYGLDRSMLNPLTYAAITLDRRGGGARATYTGEGTLFGRGAWFTLGVDLESQDDERLEHNNDGGQPGADLRKDQRDRVTSLGPFVQGHIELFDPLELTLGGRFDAVRFRTHDRMGDDGGASGERTLNAFSPVVGLTYAPSETWSVYGTLATAFQTPTTTELINAPPAEGTVCCPGGFNNDLEPQDALGYEIGSRGRLGDRVGYELAAFTMTVRGELVSYQIEGAEGRDFYRNAGRSRHRGLEAALRLRPTDATEVDAAYTYNDFRFVDDGVDGRHNGNHLPVVPRHRVVTRARYQSPFGVSTELQVAYNGTAYVDDANTTVNEAHTLADLYLRYAGRGGTGVVRLRPFLGITNLFDRVHSASVVANATGERYFEPGAPRSLHLGFSIVFGADTD